MKFLGDHLLGYPSLDGLAMVLEMLQVMSIVLQFILERNFIICMGSGLQKRVSKLRIIDSCIT